MFSITKVYSDKNGDSHFEIVRIPLKEQGDIGWLSEKYEATGVIFRVVEPTYDYDFHTAPQRQLIVLLDGEIEIETSLGERRSFQSGDILLMEDTTGKGHKTKNIVQATRRSVFILLP